MILLLGDWVPEQEKPCIGIETKDEFVLLNLEGAILNDVSNYVPALKSGPHIYSHALPTIDDASAVCFSLANNHIKDFGWVAVEHTISQIVNRGYHYVGVGINEEYAREPQLIDVSNHRYAIFGLCETQAGRSTLVQSGVANIGPWVYHAISRVRSQVDTIIVSVHAANEMLPWPSPLRQDLYRSYIDAGADIVHGHHSHVAQGVEKYKHGLICYGLGNFLGSPDRYGYFEVQLSLGVRIKALENNIDFEIETYFFQRDHSSVIVKQESTEKSLAYLAAIQMPLSDRILLEGIWQEAALWLYDKYGRDSMPLSPTTEKRYFGFTEYMKSAARRILKRHPFTRRAKHQNQIVWYNMFACMSHRNMMETALGLLCGEITDVRSSKSRDLVEELLPRTLKR